MPELRQFEPSINKVLCKLSLKTLAGMPSPVFCRVGGTLINQSLQPLIADGQLDALEGRCWKIEITDAPRSVYVRLGNGRFTVTDREAEWDVCFKGALSSFLTLALKQEDPDTLFFNRQLSISGDTELGLAIKNFIDSVEVEEVLHPPLSYVVEHLHKAFSEKSALDA